MCIGQLSTAINNTSIRIVSMLFDEDRRMMMREMEGVPGIVRIMMYHILIKKLMKKKVVVS